MMGGLTGSQENYLRTIFILSCGNCDVRLTDIAHRLGISKASACAAVTQLAGKGLVVRDSRRLISLTPYGECEAKRIMDNFTVINLFLTSGLKIDPNTALIDADALEHVVSEETLNAMRLSLETMR